MKIRTYRDLGYSTLFNPKTGFFMRVEEKGHPEPFWSPHGPELIDISITNWCDKGCAFCYRSSNTDGLHMPFEKYSMIIDSAAELGVYQVALGGGNPNQHPDFIEILSYTNANGIVPNYTTNGRGLTKDIIAATKKYAGAVAVSAYHPYLEMKNALDILTRNNIRTNIHFVIDEKSIKIAIDWLRTPPEFLNKINAIIFLNYKPIGRKVFSNKILMDNQLINEFFKLATSKNLGFKVGFDSCSVSGVISRTDAKLNTIEACDAARFSMFISEDMKAYPCSFQKSMSNGDSISSRSCLKNIWLNSPNFKYFRDHFASNKCDPCKYVNSCLNGCPIFDGISLCPKV